MSLQDHSEAEKSRGQKNTGLGSLFSCCLRRRVLTSAPAQQAVKASAVSAVTSNSTNVGGASQTSAKALADFNDTLGKLEIDVTLDVRATNIASKAEEYLNHRLQGNLKEISLEVEQLAVIRLAAKFAKEVYTEPTHKQGGYEYTQASPTDGTKAMVCGFSEPNLIVLAIKGSKQMIDWAVNFNDKTDSASEFLGNGTSGSHSGFLETARSMVESVARSLENALENRGSKSEQPIDLLFTGHSAGGAVATLLYYHMYHSGDPESSLIKIKSKFRHIHCITFGAPPITTEPLIPHPEHPVAPPEIFIAFINEGDPVVRADRPFINSLINLIVSRRPSQLSNTEPSSASAPGDASSEFFAKISNGFIWKVPSPVYYNAGHLLVLRDTDPDGEGDQIGVVKVTKEELGETIFGDPFKHAMSLYLERIEKLAQEKGVGQLGVEVINDAGTATNESI